MITASNLVVLCDDHLVRAGLTALLTKGEGQRPYFSDPESPETPPTRLTLLVFPESGRHADRFRCRMFSMTRMRRSTSVTDYRQPPSCANCWGCGRPATCTSSAPAWSICRPRRSVAIATDAPAPSAAEPFSTCAGLPATRAACRRHHPARTRRPTALRRQCPTWARVRATIQRLWGLRIDPDETFG